MSDSYSQPGVSREAPIGASASQSLETRWRTLSRSRLVVKLIAMVVLITLALGLLAYALVDRIFDSLTPTILHDLHWKARHGASELCSAMDLGVMTEDRDAVARTTAEFVSDPDVVGIAVFGRHGLIFAHGEPSEHWYRFSDEPGQEYERGQLLVVSGPVEIEGLPVGRVAVAVSTQRLRAGMQLRANILAAAGGGAGLALLLALAFVQYDIKPWMRVMADTFRELDRTTRQALTSARIKSEFLANMSHEIRTPMNGILGISKLALRNPLDPKLRRYLEVIDSSARSLLTIINDVLDFSKIEAGKYEIRPQRFVTRDLFDAATALFAVRAKEKGISLTQHVAEDVPLELIADADRIKQILVNLLGNALKFTEHGRVRVDVSMVEGEARLMCVKVTDTGAGIAREEQAALFQAFTQVDGSMGRAHGGTGLGLAIAKQLAELMGGGIGVDSEHGRGSQFWFRVAIQFMPAGSRPLSAAAPVHMSERAERRSIRTMRPVLVADDNEINRFVAVEHLRALGYAADTVENGQQAVEAVSSRRYAAVLMDCQMPGLDGYGAAREIRRRETGQTRVPIIAVTAHALPGERETVLAAGMDDYIAKPVTPGALERALLCWIGQPGPLVRLTSVPPPAAANPQPASTPVNELDPGFECSPRLTEIFQRVSVEQRAQMLRHIAERDVASARMQAHKLKGGLYAVGAARLAEAVELVRLEVADEHWSRVEQRWQEIEARYVTVSDELVRRAAASLRPPALESPA
jgi:signal transduction histidine kinase/CheY-like chemotaxis protein